MPDVALPAPFEAYTGKEPYLFASYAHVDGEIVYPELTYLHEQGYRIWYDEGIDPGNEWPEEVAKALASASHFIVFISPNAVNSRNVRNEINFAINNQKPFLAIYIKETELPPGLALRMGDIQAVMKYRMRIEMYHRKIGKTLPQNILSFKKKSGTQDTEKVTCKDIDGNIYRTVKIGGQIWTAENLKVTRYRNGDAIEHVTDNAQWVKVSTGAYCAYDNNASNAEVYGYLFNWHAVNDNRNIAPTGWHVPTDNEWKILIDYLGGDSIAGGKMKQPGASHWKNPNNGATNESGFTAIPGGWRISLDGLFCNLGVHAIFWSATEYDALYAWYRNLHCNYSYMRRSYFPKKEGFYVRLLRDN